MATVMATSVETAPQTEQVIDTSVSPIRRHVTLAILMLVAVLSYVDRQIFTLFQDDIKAELGLSDTQLGLLTGLAFALFYALAGLPIARLADRGDRRSIIAVCVVVWSAATAFCGVAQSYWQMLFARIGLAAGEAGAGPATNALVTEIYPPQRRTLVISAMLAANAVGISAGLAIGGWLSQWFGWREVFLILGIPGIAVGLIVWLFVFEPRRKGAVFVAPAARPSLGTVIRTMTGNPSLRWVSLVLCTVPLTGFAFILWGASFFQRVHGMGKAETGLWLGGAMAAGLVIGNLLAGWVSDRYSHDNPRFNGWFAGIGLLLAYPAALLFALSANAYVALACFVAVKFMMTLHLGPIMSLSFAQVPLDMRATLSATIGMIIGLAGTGVGGTLAGFLSTRFAAEYGDLSLQPALALIATSLLIGGVAAIMAGRTARLPETQS